MQTEAPKFTPTLITNSRYYRSGHGNFYFGGYLDHIFWAGKRRDGKWGAAIEVYGINFHDIADNLDSYDSAVEFIAQYMQQLWRAANRAA
jgi:hypothetical protein